LADLSASRDERDLDDRKARPSVALVLCALLVTACTERFEQIPAQGKVGGHVVATTVDDPLAKYYLERDQPGRARDPELDRRLEEAFARLAEGVPTRDELGWLGRELSTDLATLYLIERLGEVPEHDRLQDVFEGHLARVGIMAAAGSAELRACVQALALPVVWFAPGWFYEGTPETGADFHRQRALFERLGIEHRLVPVVENGTIETNAAIIADEVRALDPARDRVMLVSASKGGPEVAHAIGHLLSPAETRPVEAWVNVGGPLRGSPLADWATSWPIAWLAPLYFAYVEGRDPGDSVASLTTAQSSTRLAHEDIPEHVLIINFIGVPLSGHISKASEFGYARMRPLGPNDGLTPVIDVLAHGGGAIVQVGLDHYYRDPELDLKTLALALTVVTELGGQLPPQCRGATAS
jgi:hypothetical protein